jgi:hypothetical protein
MKLIEAVEEVQEKSSNNLSMQSIIRKINMSRDQLLRRYGRETEVHRMDLLADQPLYPWALPPGSIKSVLVNGVSYPFAYLNDRAKARYYYFLNGSIGIYPAPQETVTEGLTVFYDKTLVPLTVDALEQEIGFDRDYDMLVVYGALKTIETGNSGHYYTNKYNELLDDYLAVNTEPEHYQIRMEGW